MASSIHESSLSTRVTALLSFALILAAALIAGGCGNSDPLSSEGEPTPVSDFSFDATDVILASGDSEPQSLVNHVARYDVAQFVTPGQLATVQLTPDIELEVGPTAAPFAATIVGTTYIKRGGTAETEWVQFEFGPSMQFNVPIELRVDLQLVDGLQRSDGLFYLWYFDGRRWRLADKSEGDTSQGSVAFAVDHFSKYAIGD